MGDLSYSTRQLVCKRAGNHCELCGAIPPRNHPGKSRGSVHHRKPKRLGGPDTVTNLVLLCLTCHRRLHKNEPTAALTGWLVWDDPEVTPVLHTARGWVLLVPDGSFEPLEEAEAIRLLAWTNGGAIDSIEELAQAG